MLEVGTIEVRNEAIKALKSAISKGNKSPQVLLKQKYPNLNPEDIDYILKEAGVIPNDKPLTITELKSHIRKKKKKIDTLQKRFNEVREAPQAAPQRAFYELQSLAWQIDDLNIEVYHYESQLSSKYFGIGISLAIVIGIVGAIISIALGVGQ